MSPLSAPPPSISAETHALRIAQAQKELALKEYAALVVNAGDSLRYFTGLPWSATERLVALVIPAVGSARMVCPRFELGSLIESAKLQLDTILWEEDESPFLHAVKDIPDDCAVALDRDISLRSAEGFRLARPGIRFNADPGIIDHMRACKTGQEIALIQHAMNITIRVIQEVWAALRPGMRASEVIRLIDERHRAYGADNGSWFCAVQFGHATAFPHGIPGDQELQENDLVLIDTGCCINGYHSDITRTFAFGTPDPEHERIWNIEKQAQLAAFAAAQPGIPCEAVDQAARTVLENHGLGPDYKLPGLPHRTGHGVGLSIHEFPYVVRGNNAPLETGNCCSNEPMIVVPSRFGIRLEDHFYITPEGPRWFTEPAHTITQPFA
ncbi:MAG: Xaa-Pro peptidase family protein [Acetobacter sp.]|nr:Xaa-Pro peptidase family protein [Acetobacter sp.]MCH4061702.1 Xaa-Pro peptidase family protein [Acetobacter sp.]MCH4089449.1 Xaa-Pro peptidase family protein [Acetobacter sp.]MCI1293821.1 Xaa-Pro peptidase family protein [Acetobacter sp.]MCI1320405.1 Xaa-Pro peptidase family protein [Acetobacter sp.]